MNTKDLDVAIDEAQLLLRRLTEAQALRWHGLTDKAVLKEKSAVRSLEEVAAAMGRSVCAPEMEGA